MLLGWQRPHQTGFHFITVNLGPQNWKYMNIHLLQPSLEFVGVAVMLG